MSNINNVLEYIDQHQTDYLEALKELLRIPSVSTKSEHAPDVRAAGEWVKNRLTNAGFEATLYDTAKHPIVMGQKCEKPEQPTVLIYGHYDVQPPEPFELWETPPFEPTERDGNLYARGATDDKGQMLTHILALEAYLKTAGEFPINVKVILEGEEEIGSPNLIPFIEAHKDELAADYVIISDTAQLAENVPAITYGLKGIVGCEIRLTGPKRDLHSGSFGGAVPNPVHELCALIAKMHDEKGRVAIPGFYDNVLDLEAWEREMFANLPFDEQEFIRYTGVKKVYGEAGYTTWERKTARPTLEVNGIGGGYQGEGGKTIVPSTAFAKITMRLVPNQDPHRIEHLIETFVRENCPDTVYLEFEVGGHSAEAVLVDSSSDGMKAARRAIKKGFGIEPVLIREGGSIPIVSTFKKILGCDSLLLGWGLPDDNVHSPNEKFSIRDFYRGIRTSAILLDELAQ